MTYLVTGAAGFIGFHVSERLLKGGHSVLGVDNLNDYYDIRLKESRLTKLSSCENFQFHRLDISDRANIEFLAQAAGEATYVIHLAAQAGVRYSLTNPYAYTASNVERTPSNA